MCIIKYFPFFVSNKKQLLAKPVKCKFAKTIEKFYAKTQKNIE